jgi:type IV pilus assembly protein PilX
MNRPSRQRGIVLVVSLIVLLALSVVAVTAARGSRIELISAGAVQSSAGAFLNAEAVLVVAEDDIATNHSEGGPSFNFDGDDDGYYTEGGVDPDTLDWSDFEYESVDNNDGDEIGRYVIEYLGTISSDGGSLGVGSASSERHIYRVTALGIGERNSMRLVSTIYATL